MERPGKKRQPLVVSTGSANLEDDGSRCGLTFYRDQKEEKENINQQTPHDEPTLRVRIFCHTSRRPNLLFAAVTRAALLRPCGCNAHTNKKPQSGFGVDWGPRHGHITVEAWAIMGFFTKAKGCLAVTQLADRLSEKAVCGGWGAGVLLKG